MAASAPDVKSGRARLTVRDLWAPSLINLLLGLPAMIPLYSARWFWTDYFPMDCRSIEDAGRPEVTNCNYTTLDHAAPMMLFLAVSALAMLTLVLVVNVILPLRLGGRLAAWLWASVLLPVPFVMTVVLL